jgi:pyruvate dehydrogenase E1 component alpha subunit
MFDHLYATLPRALEAQLAMALAFAPEKGKKDGDNHG